VSDTGRMMLIGIVLLVVVIVMQPQTSEPAATTDQGTAGGLDLNYAYGNSGYASTQSGNGYYAGGVGYGSAQGGQYQGGTSVSDPGGDTDTLARVIYGEARGQSQAAQQGVASVVLNRVNTIGTGFGQLGGISGVCLAPSQFDCMSPPTPGHSNSNYSATMNVQAGDTVFDGCLALAAQAVAGNLPDNTEGATYYHDTSIATPASWTRAGFQETVQIGALIFFSAPGLRV
jgi:N-acetylmuramoyl-L-alanine amidase